MSSKNAQDPNLPVFATIDSIKEDIEAMENNEAVWTPEWVRNALMSAWEAGRSAGDVSAYFGGLHEQRNPFMTPAQSRAWYGEAR